ncbi:unnamed protein product [Cunninghamella blakesleeana]
MTYHKEKECTITIPIKKIIGSLEVEPFQQLQIQCTQLIDYVKLQNNHQYHYHLPLDIIKNALFKVLSNQFGFKPRLGDISLNQFTSVYNHSNIHSFHIKMDEDGNEIMNNMNQSVSVLIERSFMILFCKHLSYYYPLIFSPSYVEKLNASTKYIPNIARSLERFLSIADTSSRLDFKEKAQESLNITKEKIFNLYQKQQGQQNKKDNMNDHLLDDLVVSLYYSTKNLTTLRNHKNVVKINE